MIRHHDREDDTMTTMTPAQQWAYWTRMGEEAARRRADAVAAEVARQGEIHGARGAQRRAAEALGITPGRVSQLLQEAGGDPTQETRQVGGRTWTRTVMGKGGPRGWWRTTGPHVQWVLYAETAPDASPSAGSAPAGDLAPVARWILAHRGGGAEQILDGRLTEEEALAEAGRIIDPTTRPAR